MNHAKCRSSKQTPSPSASRRRQHAPVEYFLSLTLFVLINALLQAGECQPQLVLQIPSGGGGGDQQQQQQFVVQPRQIVVPGSVQLARGDPTRVERIIYPNEQPAAKRLYEQQQQQPKQQQGRHDNSGLLARSYIIDHKRFVESVSSRCFASTILENPDELEPSFIIIRPNSEIRLNATASSRAILQANFEPHKPTTLAIHGFTQSYPSTEWLRKLRALFEVNSHIQRQNLIIMDWGAVSHGSYSQVAAHANGMGSFLANFLMKLIEELGADRMSIHLIGHSLGAHIAGFASKRLWPRLGRITGLDPAGPCFGKLYSNAPTDRLAPDDAYEVDVYHYDDDFLGLAGQSGQFDVYVNGGASQPGASDNMNSVVDAAITMMFRRNRPLSESHKRSTEVPTVRLSDCQEIAYECRDWPAFLVGECGQCDQANSQCHMMSFNFQYSSSLFEQPAGLRRLAPPLGGAGGGSGATGQLNSYHTQQVGKRLYVATSSASDKFCLQHHQILVKFEPSPELAQQAKRNRWRLHLELFNELNERLNVTLTNQLGPNVFSHLLLSDTRPAKFRAALMQVRQLDNTLVPLRERRKTSHAIYGPSAPPVSGASGGPGGGGGGGVGGTAAGLAPARINQIEINFMSHINPNVRRALSSRLCPSNYLRAPLGQANYNAIADASLVNDEWLSFDDC